MTTDQPNIPYIPPLYRGDQPHTHGTPPPAELTLTPRAVERNTLPSMDLLERALELITELAANGHDGSTGTERVVTNWIADYRKLCTDER